MPSDFEEKSGGVFLHDFNEVVKEKLQGLLSWDFKPGSFFDNPIYYIGWVVNFPWYLLTRFIAKRLTKGTVHTDSVYFAFLIFTLPIYWGILIAILT